MGVWLAGVPPQFENTLTSPDPNNPSDGSEESPPNQPGTINIMQRTSTAPNQIKAYFQCVFLAPLLALVVGCATGAKPEAMTLGAVNVQNTHEGSATVQVTGGGETNPMWFSGISSEAFQTALIDSMRVSGIFAQIATEGDSGYRLDVKLVRLIQPMMGFNMTVTAVTEWRLTRVETDKLVMEEFISTPYTATVGAAFAGIKRLRLANEGAARENIQEGIQRISRVNLDQNENTN